LCLAVLIGLSACAARADAATEHALRRLDIVTASRHAVTLDVEIADDPGERARGLMFRKFLPANRGMLFLYSVPVRVSFWMKNTYIPLDILFIDEAGTITRIAARAAPLSTTAIPSGGPTRAVLEIPGGRAAALGIRAGDHVIFEPLWSGAAADH
jgi:uncharacterized protein